MDQIINLVEKGVVPDSLLRPGIRHLLQGRIDQEYEGGAEAMAERLYEHIEAMDESPIAMAVEDANRQHYEVPTEFFQLMLGPRMKYSSCLYPDGVEGLAEAEDAMLSLTCERAELEDGMDILELGCGWGALTLWMAERYPGSRITAVSNSSGQRSYIEAAARDKGLTNIKVITADMNAFQPEGQYDRAVSLEMFEHMRNWRKLLDRLSGWLKPEGKVFIHIFVHMRAPYFFETGNAKDWMAEHFFTGGMMPSEGLMAHFQDRLMLERHWVVNGEHYQKTLMSWLARLDDHKTEALRICSNVYGEEERERWFMRWRMFLLACAELFGFKHGEEWYVGHYLLKKN